MGHKVNKKEPNGILELKTYVISEIKNPLSTQAQLQNGWGLWQCSRNDPNGGQEQKMGKKTRSLGTRGDATKWSGCNWGPGGRVGQKLDRITMLKKWWQNFPRFDENYKVTGLRSSTKPKQEEHKVIAWWAFPTSLKWLNAKIFQ